MPKANINGVNLYYDEQGSGEPVLIHHGYTGSHYSWDGVAPILAKKYRVFRMDGRGTGDSDHPAGGHTIEQFAKDVIGMADHLGLKKFTYIGHSMGGVIGFELGINYLSRLERLVLVAPAPSDGVKAAPSVHEAATNMRNRQDPEALARQNSLLSANPQPWEKAVEDAKRRLKVSQAHFDEAWDALMTFNKAEKLAGITVPTLVVAGAADGLLQANLADFQRLPNATLHVFSRVSHGIPVEASEPFAHVILDFLEHGVVTAATLSAQLAAANAAGS